MLRDLIIPECSSFCIVTLRALMSSDVDTAVVLARLTYECTDIKNETGDNSVPSPHVYLFVRSFNGFLSTVSVTYCLVTALMCYD